jgi:hypothetical protein
MGESIESIDEWNPPKYKKTTKNNIMLKKLNNKTHFSLWFMCGNKHHEKILVLGDQKNKVIFITFME